MFTHTHIVWFGALLAIPLSQSLQCGRHESKLPCGDDSSPAQVVVTSTKDLEELGKHVFFDNISVPKRMSCATCHDPAAGWTLKNSGVNQHQVAVTGADPHTAGAIKPPSNAYASGIGKFGACNIPLLGRCGGVFWNGRAEGNAGVKAAGATDNVGDEVFENGLNLDLKPLYAGFLGPVADQALNPFPNKVEQNIEIRQVCQHVAASKYAPLFESAWGEPIDCSESAYGSNGFKAFEVNFRRIAVALAAWQASDEVNSFSSKRDIALAAEADGQFPLNGLTAQENLGHDLFYSTILTPATIGGQEKITNCATCHSDNPFGSGGAPPDNGTEKFQLYADDSFHNIGTPANPEIAGFPTLDLGLEGHTGDPGHRGAHKTPTLRNVDKRPGAGFTKAYTHNGWFKSLESLVHFYNTSDVDGETAKSFGITRCDPKSSWTEKQALAANCWPAPEQGDNLAIGILVGDMGLTAAEEAAIVAYLKTFSDTKTPKPPKPFK